jgi:flagellar biosynthesis chaperone FliJ
MLYRYLKKLFTEKRDYKQRVFNLQRQHAEFVDELKNELCAVRNERNEFKEQLDNVLKEKEKLESTISSFRCIMQHFF